MEHWFIKWLESYEKKCQEKLGMYINSLNPKVEQDFNVRNSFSSTSEIYERIEEIKDQIEELKKWIKIVGDMIRCGLEQQALQYYDVKQTLDRRLPLRESKEGSWILDEIAEQLELKIESCINPSHVEQLQAIYSTLCELFSVEMEDVFLTYYLRIIRKYPELNLPNLRYIDS